MAWAQRRVRLQFCEKASEQDQDDHGHLARRARGPRVKVSTLNSVSAKLFYLMSMLVLITVSGNSFQYVKTFMDHQTRQVQDDVQRGAESAGAQIEGIFETWRSQIAVALPTLQGLSDA